MTTTLRHCVVTYDPAYTEGGYWATIAKNLFQDNKALIVAEKIHINAHVHIQGHTMFCAATIKERMSKLTAGHWARNHGKKRIVKYSKKPCDEFGFQYMCKEAKPNVLYSCGFEPGEIEKLHEKSVERVEEVKNTLKVHLHGHEFYELESDPELLHAAYREIGFKFYSSQSKLPPPNFQKQVLNAMGTKYPQHIRYVSARI